MKKTLYIFSMIIVSILFSCREDNIPMVSLGLDNVYIMPRMKTLPLTPAFTGQEYNWTMQTASGRDSLLSTQKDYIFLPKDTGTYHLTFNLIDPANPLRHNIDIYVVEEEVAYSAYIAHVYEYMPAPGQFINKLPYYEAGNTTEDMRQKAEASISGTVNQLVSLGGYGGYISFGFDHTVINVAGERDFMIYGNSFYADSNAQPGTENASGSSEPGIVMVSFDANQNGIPDDEWYELAGSEYYKPETIHDYEITYYKPNPNKTETPDAGYPFYRDTTYIKWTSNQNDYGYIIKNIYHNQSYYPQWISAEKISFGGTKLADNFKDLSGSGSYYIQYPYSWGYADNHPNEAKLDSVYLISFDIDWAVDKNGNKIHLPGIDFIRVYTGVNQYCGWLGETSTEISKAQDMHVYVKPTQQQKTIRK